MRQEKTCCALSFGINLLLSAERRDMTLLAEILFFRLQPAISCITAGTRAEKRRRKSMWCKSKAMSYYSGWMMGEEYNPQGSHNTSRGWKGKDCRKTQTILGLRRRIFNKGWVLNCLLLLLELSVDLIRPFSQNLHH